MTYKQSSGCNLAPRKYRHAIRIEYVFYNDLSTCDLGFVVTWAGGGGGGGAGSDNILFSVCSINSSCYSPKNKAIHISKKEPKFNMLYGLG